MTKVTSFKDRFKAHFVDVFRVPKDDRHDDRGFEKLDDTPMELPIGFKRPPTLQEQVARLVRSEAVRAHAESLGKESFDEADDFDDPEDDPTTPYEKDFDIATVQAANSGFIEESPIPRTRKEELLNRYSKARSKLAVKEGKSPSKPSQLKEGDLPSDDDSDDDSKE